MIRKIAASTQGTTTISFFQSNLARVPLFILFVYR